MRKIEATLLFLRKEDKILLAMKKRGFGTGRYNGIGGKLNEGETVEEAMIRETEEEIFVTPIEYNKVAIIDFIEINKGELENMIVHIYVATKWEGAEKESEEMKPEWFDIQEIPYDKMFEDDSYWLPLVLEGKKIKANFRFDENWKMLSKEIEEVSNLD